MMARLMSDETCWYFSVCFPIVFPSRSEGFRAGLGVNILQLCSVDLGSFKHTPELQGNCENVKTIGTHSVAQVWQLGKISAFL